MWGRNEGGREWKKEGTSRVTQNEEDEDVHEKDKRVRKYKETKKRNKIYFLYLDARTNK